MDLFIINLFSSKSSSIEIINIFLSNHFREPYTLQAIENRSIRPPWIPAVIFLFQINRLNKLIWILVIDFIKTLQKCSTIISN